MKAQIVSFRCVLSNRLGAIISKTVNRDVITQADGQGDCLKGLVEGLQDLHKGEKRRIFVPADRAYGWYDQRLVMEIPKRKMPSGSPVKIGQEVMSQSFDGEYRPFRVIQSKGRKLVLDGNHPLAGQDLIFDIEVIDARDATPADLEDTECPPDYH